MFFKKKKIQVIECEVTIPKKGDILIIQIPDATEGMLRKFQEMWNQVAKKGKGTLFMNKEVKINLVKKRGK